MTDKLLEGIPFDNYIPPNWDEWFMKIMYLVAQKSKDPSTKIGAVLVRDKRIVSVGYNGLPRGVNDDVPERSQRPIKYNFYEHGERNCLYAAGRYGISTDGTIMYTNGIPCTDCARGVIQSGVSKVVVHKPYEELSSKAQQEKLREQWKGHNEISTTMFNESGVKLEIYDGFLHSFAYFNGKKYLV